jgi:hypothetical protein
MFGVTGYVTLQSEYVVADAKINLHTVALHLAQEKFTDLVLNLQTPINTKPAQTYKQEAHQTILYYVHSNNG